ncbi:hypothetical protein [Bradyrhizobium sp. SYSU BS000235]|uniref:hypothetical protein n=1 Tax=Bradyrhizobium sp. SYSU BS000235 TaxID=3411332 RepID=UPI003C760CCB
MTSDTPSRGAVTLTWLVLVLAVLLLVWGAIKYGISLDIQQRFWSDIFARFGGPMTFRFFLQPTMAAIAAVHDGLKDAREGHKSFFWTGWRHPSEQTGRLREGLISTARIMLLGISMDVIYQFKELDQFYPAEAVVIAILLAVIPYFIFRWIIEWIARRWMHHGRPAQ